MNPALPFTPVRAAAPILAMTLAMALAGCTVTSSDSPTVDYRSGGVKTAPLDVPPDLTQLAREGRYQAPASVVSASTIRPAGPAAAAAPLQTTPVAAPVIPGDLRIDRQGTTRWLVTPMPAAALYPIVRKFWNDSGFPLVIDDPAVGLMETEWAENRAKLPQDWLRGTIGKAFDGLYSTGERDKYRTRIETTATGSEVFITHRGMIETYTDGRKDQTEWQSRPRDAELEAEFLIRLMVKLGAKEDAARTAVAAAATPAGAASAPPAAPPGMAAPAAKAAAPLLPATAMVELEQSFDRAWRQVGVALDRSGFTIEDRDRGAGLYFVRYINPKLAGKEEPNFFAKLFSSEKEVRPQRLRIAVKAVDKKTQVSVQTSEGQLDNSEQARAIIGRLTQEMK